MQFQSFCFGIGIVLIGNPIVPWHWRIPANTDIGIDDDDDDDGDDDDDDGDDDGDDDDDDGKDASGSPEKYAGRCRMNKAAEQLSKLPSS